jgi:predicted amidohydrolase
VANWPEKRISHWEALLRARAIENQCYVIGVNRVGIDGKNLVYSGESQIINMFGVKEIEFLVDDCIINHTLSTRKLDEGREQLPFLEK